MPSGTPDRIAADQLEMDDVFKALADPTRRQLLDSLKQQSGQTLRELCADLTMARQSVSKHLAILEAANLITTIRHGREKLHYVNPAPINDITERWINQYDQPRIAALSDLKKALEEPPMSKPAFVYTTYVKTTPEQMWKALTEPAFTERYWQTALETDWAEGSPMVWDFRGLKVAGPEQIVLESDPYRRLTYTWHTFTTEWAQQQGIAEEVRAKIAAEPRSKVTFEIEPEGPMVKLTVLHDDLEPDGTLVTMITHGWPRIVADIKTLLETGETLVTE
jgi:DNA-binding transcriptional ArsR family regulator/uncharacterized protein YndB with AHSA1/START domain